MGSCTSKPAKLVPIINPSQPELTKKKNFYADDFRRVTKFKKFPKVKNIK